MSNDGTSSPLDRHVDPTPPPISQPTTGNASDGSVLPHSNGNGTDDNGGQQNGVVVPSYTTTRLRLNPNADHKPDSYENLDLDFSPFLFSSLERYLPSNLLSLSRDVKVTYMRDVLLRYSPESERVRVSTAVLDLHMVSVCIRCITFQLLNLSGKARCPMRVGVDLYITLIVYVLSVYKLRMWCIEL